jgi:cobalt-zinc-cadmium efflux system protein
MHNHSHNHDHSHGHSHQHADPATVPRGAFIAGIALNGAYVIVQVIATILAALTNAMVLLIAIGMMAFESISRLMHPEPVKGETVAWVAGLGIVINTVSALLCQPYCFSEAKTTT